MKYLVLALGLSLASVTGFAVEDEATTGTTAKSDKATTAAEGKGAGKMAEMYRAAGVSDEQIQQLNDLQKQIREAKKAGDKAKAKELSEKRKSILTPEQAKKIGDSIPGRVGKDKKSKKDGTE